MAIGDGDERTLAERARAGDETAFRALWDAATPRVRRRLERLLPPALRRKVDVDDVLQEASIVAVRRIGEFEARGEGAFAAWLQRIAELKLREAVRRFLGTAKRGREVTKPDRPSTAKFEGRGPSPSEVAQAAELRARASVALDALAPDYREILHLVQIEMLPLAEAAVRMNRTPEAARKLYGRALSRYAEMLDVEEGRRG